MAETGALRTPEPIPDWSKEWPPASLKFPLRATPKPFIRLMAGSSNQSFTIFAPTVPEWPELFRHGRLIRAPKPAGIIELAGLVHARSIPSGVYGAGTYGNGNYGDQGPKVNVAFAVSGLSHSRGLGGHAVATTVPPDPPVPPVTPPGSSGATLSGGPRSIRGVRRRNVKHR